MNVIPIRRSLMPALMLVSASCSKPQQPAQPVPGASSGSTTANTLTDGERAAGWKLLFDGKTGAGWRGYRQQTLPAGWQVKDGALPRVAEAGDIITDEQFKNFELALEWKISPGGNSGIFYRASEDSDARSEEHTSELQSPCNLVCRLLLEKKKTSYIVASFSTPVL